MVKKLISGMLKKEAKAPKEEPAVPDELPALGEDTAQAAQPEQASDAPPDELPGLDEAPIPTDVRPTPQEPSPAPPPISPVHDQLPPAPERTEPPKDGYFTQVADMVNKGVSINGILSQDLISNMKENWGIQKESSKTGLSALKHRSIAAHLESKLTELRFMESKWRAQKMVLEEDQRILAEFEESLRDQERELKALLRKAKLFQRVPDDRIILLKDSIPVRSIGEMINALRRIDYKTFAYFISRTRNRWAELAGAIEPELGAELKKVTDRKTMLIILDRYVTSLG